MNEASIEAIMKEIELANDLNSKAKIKLENSIKHFENIHFDSWPSINTILIVAAYIIILCFLCKCIC